MNYTNDVLPLDLPIDKIEKIKSRVSKKRSIKTIMKDRIEKMKKKECSTQNNDS